jgi:hypothetical protein
MLLSDGSGSLALGWKGLTIDAAGEIGDAFACVS